MWRVWKDELFFLSFELSALLLPFKLNCGCLLAGWDWRGLMNLTWWVLGVFFAFLYKMTIPEELFWTVLSLKSPSLGNWVKTGQIVWLNAMISFCAFFFFYVLHTRRRHVHSTISAFLAPWCLLWQNCGWTELYWKYSKFYVSFISLESFSRTKYKFRQKVVFFEIMLYTVVFTKDMERPCRDSRGAPFLCKNSACW